jgi:hypothetical protein
MAMSAESRRDDQALRAVWRELRKPRNLWRYLRKSGDLTVPLIFAGPTFVALSYVVAYAVTPNARASADFHATAAQIIPVLLLVLAIEGQLFRWGIANSSLTVSGRDDVVRDARFQKYAAGRGSISDAVDAVLDAAVDTARNVADALLRQATALLLLASLLVGEIVSLVPLLTNEPHGTTAKPIMAAIVAGFAGVAYVAITGSRFLRSADESSAFLLRRNDDARRDSVHGAVGSAPCGRARFFTAPARVRAACALFVEPARSFVACARFFVEPRSFADPRFCLTLSTVSSGTGGAASRSRVNPSCARRTPAPA